MGLGRTGVIMPFMCIAKDCSKRLNSDADIEYSKEQEPDRYDECEIRCRHCGQKYVFLLNRGSLEIQFPVSNSPKNDEKRCVEPEE